jgi:hypothetical protein
MPRGTCRWLRSRARADDAADHGDTDMSQIMCEAGIDSVVVDLLLIAWGAERAREL